jgi:hypothetical protein
VVWTTEAVKTAIVSAKLIEVSARKRRNGGKMLRVYSVDQERLRGFLPLRQIFLLYQAKSKQPCMSTVSFLILLID